MRMLHSIMFVLLVTALPLSAAWARNLAGFVIVSVGDVTAYDTTTDQERKLKRRSKIFEGDEIRTGQQAKVQLKFKDKGVIALQANTQLQISEYEYSGLDGNPERSFFKLVKGGFRAISGAIGKQNPEDYKVETPLATIGIRGTDYSALFATRLQVKVHAGAVQVSNEMGSVLVGDGHDFRFAVVDSSQLVPKGVLNLELDQSAPEADTGPDAKDGEPEQEASRNEPSADGTLLTDQKVYQADKQNTNEPHNKIHRGGPRTINKPPQKPVEESRTNSDDPEAGSIRTGTNDLAIRDDSLFGSGSSTDDTSSTDSNTTDSGTGGTNTGGTDTGGTDTGGTDTGGTDTGGTVDSRISSTELAEIGGHWGIASIDKEPDPASPQDNVIGGLARDESSGLPGLFVDKGVPPDDPNFADQAIVHVLRQATHVSDQTAFARFDTAIDTTVSALNWGRWSGGEARLYTDATDGTVYTPITNDFYWFTGSPADMSTVPATGEARFDNTFLLAGNGSAGPIIDQDPASVSIGFTLNWLNNTVSDGEIRIVNGVQGNRSQQTEWRFANLSGTLENSAGSRSPILNFAPSTGEVCVAQCSIPMTASGEIEAFLLEGNEQIAGHFLFWEDGNPAEWVNGIFAVGKEQRYTGTEQQNLNRAFMGVYQESPFESTRVTNSALVRGKSETPGTGDFLMVDNLEQPYGAVIRLGSGIVETDYAGGSSSIHGHSVDWGAWNGSSIDKVFTGSPVFATEKYSWISYVPVDAALMDSLSSQISFSLPYVFYGWQYNSGNGTDVPLQLEYGYINVDLAGDTLDGALVFYGTGRFDVSFSGSTMGDGITVESSTAYFDGAPVNISMDGQYIGSTFADGIAGGFKIGDPGNLDLYASGVYGFGRDERIDSSAISTFNQAGFLSVDEADSLGSNVYAGLATIPSSGDFTFREDLAGGNRVWKPITSSPMFNSAMLGSTQVDWGAWDDPVGSAQVQDNPLDATSVANTNSAVSWVVGTPSDLTDIPTTGISTYGTVVGFVGYENALPLSTPSAMSMSVDFASQSFSANMTVSASTNTWDMTYNGSLSGNRLSGSGTGTWNSSPASGVIQGALVGTGSTTPAGAGPEGIMGTFKNHVDGNPSTHSSGAFVLQQ